MEVKTEEIIRFIILKFKEQDLKNILGEINFVEEKLKASYHGNESMEKIKTLLEFYTVVHNALNTLIGSE